MQICSFRESVTKARGPPAPKLLSKTAGCTAGKIVGAPRRAGPQGHRSVSGEFALSRGVSHPISCRANLDSLARRSSFLVSTVIKLIDLCLQCLYHGI